MLCDYCSKVSCCTLIASESNDCPLFYTKLKAGDSVYAITRRTVNGNTVYRMRELRVAILHSEDMMLSSKDNHMFYYRQSDIGKLIFYNCDMAQKALDRLIAQGG